MGLVALLGAPWYEVTTQVDASSRPFVIESDAWTPLTTSDIAIAALAALGGVLAYAAIASRESTPSLPLAALCGVGATGIVIYRMVEVPGQGGYSPPASREIDLLWGAWLALGCGLVLVIASLVSWQATRREGS
jgi:hypothetical protein